jgi:hypothetical protein
MSNFTNTKRIAFSFSRSKVSTSRNVKNDDSIPFVTGMTNSSTISTNSQPENTSQMGLYTCWSDFVSSSTNQDKHFFQDIQVEEHDINLNSGDRDVLVNSNPLNFTVWLSPGSTRTKSFLPKVFKNVKYIAFEHIIFPKFSKLNMYSGMGDLSANIFIQDISNFVFVAKPDDNLVSPTNPNISYQICNVYKLGSEVKINFTVNYDNAICWELIYSSKTLNKYIPSLTSGSTNYIQHICIQPTNNRFVFNTKNISEFRPVYPKLNKSSDLFLAIKKTFVVYKNSDLLNIYKFDIKLLDSSYQPIIINNLDLNVTNFTKCSCNYPTDEIKYSCPCYYPRHPMYFGYQLDLFLKIGTLVPELNRKSYFN